MTNNDLLDAEIALTRDMVATVLNVESGTVENLHRSGALKGIKIGKELRWRPDDVRQFVQNAEPDKN